MARKVGVNVWTISDFVSKIPLTSLHVLGTGRRSIRYFLGMSSVVSESILIKYYILLVIVEIKNLARERSQRGSPVVTGPFNAGISRSRRVVPGAANTCGRQHAGGNLSSCPMCGSGLLQRPLVGAKICMSLPIMGTSSLKSVHPVILDECYDYQHTSETYWEPSETHGSYGSIILPTIILGKSRYR